MHWTDLAIAALTVGAGCAAIYAELARVIRRAVSGQEQENARQLKTLSAKVNDLEAQIAELRGSPDAKTGHSELPAVSGGARNATGAQSERLKPETLVAITAAATAILGKKARVRSVQTLPVAQDNSGAWAQQGRVIVQTSHNLRPRG